MENLQEQFIAAILNNNTNSAHFSILYNALFGKVKRISSLILSKHNFQKICGVPDYCYLEQEAEDVATESLIIAIEKIQKENFEWTGNDSLIRFLSTIVKNICFTRIKKIPKNTYKVNLAEQLANIQKSRCSTGDIRKMTFDETNDEVSNNLITAEKVFENLEIYISSPRLKQLYNLIIKGVSDEKIRDVMGYENTKDVRKRRYEAYKNIREQADKKSIYQQERMAA